eukprot:gene1540-1937_t
MSNNTSIDVSEDSKFQDECEDDGGVLEDGVSTEETNNNEKKDETPKDKKMKGALQSLMKQMVSSKQPIYRMSLPICFSEPRSLLERFTDMGNFLDIFLQVSTIESEEQRFLEILKFYLSSWLQHKKDARNPFNPIIGEIHTCKWDHKDGSTTEYIAEQISHHPPSSAFCFYNKSKGVLLHSYLVPTSKFWGNSFESCMDGKLIFEVPKFEEEYIVDFPKFTVKGIVVGSLQTEVTGSTNLSCKKSGYFAEIEFKGRGMFKNKNSLLVKVRHPSSKKSLYTLEGKWDGTVNIINSKTNANTLFFDSNTPICQPILPPEDVQEENFSRRVWKHVIENINLDNEEEAQTQKHKVEEDQRVLAKSREGKPWSPTHFVKSDTTFMYSKLADIRNDC